MRKISIALLCTLFILSLGSNNLLMLATHRARGDSEGVYVYPFHVAGIYPDDTSPHGLTPTQIRTAYSLPSTGGHGTIAIIDAFDDPTVFSDSNVFSTQFNLPILNSSNFEKHMMASNINFDSGWATEISADVQWAHAIAPSSKILLVEATSDEAILPNGTAGPLLNAVDYARNRSDVVAVSMSWGTGSGGLTALGYNETAYNSFFTSSNNAVFFAGSGDQAENASWPASSPNVVGVGGTSLNFNADGSVANETVWNDDQYATGGGVSSSEPEPSYQVSYGVQSNSHRAIPDVSYFADQNPGYPIFANFSGQQWQNWGGTSFGTPQWAAIQSDGLFGSNDRYYAIANSPNYSSCFRDITMGSNGNYNATKGYDYCTGLGSPLTTAFHYPPGNATLSGPLTIVRNVWYSYTTNDVIDPDGGQIRYHLNATGPGTPYQNTTIWVSSGTPMSWNLMWETTDSPGTYLLQTWIEDSYEMFSNMTSLSVTMVGTASCALKTTTEGCFYVPNPAYVNATFLRVEMLFNSSIDGDQTGVFPSPYPAIANYPDGQVVMNDIGVVAAAYLSSEGQSKWNYMADLTGPNGVPDRLVDMMDVGLVASNWGNTGSYITNTWGGVQVLFNTGQNKSPNDAGFVAIPSSATSFNVTRNGTPIGAMIIFCTP